MKVLEEIHNADSGAPCSAKHVKKKQFIDSIKKALSPGHSSKAVTDAAAVTCVKLCKAATYINNLESNNVIFSLVQTVKKDLNLLLFKPDKPFSRGAPYQKEDIDLMIDCFLANFRINKFDNNTLIVSSFTNCTVWGGRLCTRFCNMFSGSCLLAWATWQLQFSPTVCGTLKTHVTKQFPQPAAPDCIVYRYII